MVRRLAILAVAALTLSGCGGSNDEASTTTAPVETITSGGDSNATSLRTFFFRDGALVPVTVSVPATQAVARASLQKLLEGPQTGYSTAIPDGVELRDVSVADGIATADFSGALGTPTRSAQGQIVRTLTQFPSVRAATIEVDGKPVAAQNGAGDELTHPATAADYGDLTSDALIFVRTPARDATVSSPIDVAGTASVFEATLQVEAWQDGKRVASKTVTASTGAPQRGTWSTSLTLPKGDVTLRLFEASAEDGSPLHETQVPLHVT